jgi:hypothetical protein
MSIMRPAIAEQLWVRGIDAQTKVEARRAHRAYSDTSQLAYATEQGRIFASEQSHVAQLSQTHQPHAGVGYVPVLLSIGACREYLELLARTTTADEMRDQLLYRR